MRFVIIADKHPRGFLAFDLAEILEALGEAALSLEWTVRFVECMGDGVADLELLGDHEVVVGGPQLLALARRVYQVTDGMFIGRRRDAEAPALSVEAVDSSCYQVGFEDPAVLTLMQNRFRDVTESPP